MTGERDEGRPAGTEWAPRGEPPAPPAPGPPHHQGAPVGRRVFLGVCALGAIGVAIGSQLQRIVAALVSSVTNTDGAGLGALIPGASRFRLYTVTGNFPSIPNRRYRLEVGGLVERPVTLTYAELQSLPRTELVKPFQCVTGWRVPNVEWAGVLLRDVLALVRPRPEAHAVEFSSYDGIYTESLTLEEAHRSDVLVAYQMLEGPISSGHGGPVRLYVAPMYGYKSIKWLKSISLVEAAVPGFWEQQGYAVEAWIGRSNGRDDAPVD